LFFERHSWNISKHGVVAIKQENVPHCRRERLDADLAGTAGDEGP